MKKMVLAAVLGFAAFTGAYAQSTGGAGNSKWQLYFSLGQAYSIASNSDITSGYVRNCASGCLSPYSINSGSGNAVLLGASYSVTPEYDVQVNVGHEISSGHFVNGEEFYRRNPVELMAFRNVGPHWRLGAGARTLLNANYAYHIENDTTVNGTTTNRVSEASYNFKNDMPSLALEAQYLTARYGNKYGRFGASVKLILGERIKYESLSTFNGDHLTFSLGYLY